MVDSFATWNMLSAWDLPFCQEPGAAGLGLLKFKWDFPGWNPFVSASMETSHVSSIRAYKTQVLDEMECGVLGENGYSCSLHLLI